MPNSDKIQFKIMCSKAKTFKLVILVLNLFVKRTSSINHGQVIEKTILQGQNITLPCPLDHEISGGQVQWQSGGFGLGFDPSLPEYPRYRYMRSEAGCDLVITPVTLEDHATFTCSVFSGGKVQVASIVKLQVLVGVSQPQILQNNPVVMVEGDTVTLQCMSQGKPAPEISWQDERGNLIAAAVNSSTMRHGTEMFRTISELPVTATRTEAPSIKVFCLAQNNAETKTSSVSVMVQHRPELELRQVNTVGSTLQFRCDIRARPRAHRVDWYLNTKPLSAQLVHDGVLSLTFSPDLIGSRIACKAENDVGEQVEYLTITYEDKHDRVTPHAAASVNTNEEKQYLGLQREGDPGSSAPLYVFIIISVVTTALCMLVAAAVVIYLRKLRRQTLSRNNKCLGATNRFGGQDFMNNEEALIKDLMSTRQKGVEEQRFVKDLPLLPVELSPRSSLRSFFVDPDKTPADHGQDDEVEVGSAVVSSVLDSGVYFIENQEKVEDQNLTETTQVIENCQRIETSV